MNEYALPILLVLFASVFQGTFGLGMKYVKPLAWEAWWLVHATVAMVLFPVAWAIIAVPNLWEAIAASPAPAVGWSMLFGFLWGVGGIMFGVSVRYVGVSLTYGIVMGLAAFMGSLIPLLQIENVGDNPALPYVLVGLAILVLGVALAAYAGIRRDKVQAAGDQEAAGIAQGQAFRIGLAIAITSGVLSALLNVGFNASDPIGKQVIAAATEGGEVPSAVARNSALARWVVVLAGAYVMNAGYALILLVKNGSFGSFSTPGAAAAYKWAIIAGLLWFAALGVYGQGAALMGEMGPVIGWPMLLGLSLIVSNALAVWAGEWRGAAGPLRIMVGSVAVLIAACCLLAFANTVKPEPVSPEAPPVAMARDL
ncbi:MAG: L-rhamnose/proton symporter RhaT [Planctomycetota bacterium]